MYVVIRVANVVSRDVGLCRVAESSGHLARHRINLRSVELR